MCYDSLNGPFYSYGKLIYSKDTVLDLQPKMFRQKYVQFSLIDVGGRVR